MKTSKKIIIAITAVAIFAAGMFFKQEFFLTFPLFISLFVMGFQSEANRVGLLLGAINSIIYTVAYIYMGVYASAASAFLFNFPMQLFAFFNWKKKPYKNTVVFKRMTNKQRAVFGAGILLLWLVSGGLLVYFNYEYAVLDSITFILSFAVLALTMLAYTEYTYLSILQAVIGLFLNIQMVFNDYKETTYLIYGVYYLYCVICAFVNVRKFYAEQNSSEPNE